MLQTGARVLGSKDFTTPKSKSKSKNTTVDEIIRTLYSKISKDIPQSEKLVKTNVDRFR